MVGFLVKRALGALVDGSATKVGRAIGARIARHIDPQGKYDEPEPMNGISDPVGTLPLK